MLAMHGELGEIGDTMEVVFDERAGPVPVTITRRPNGRFRCDLTAPEALSIGATVSVADIAAATGLDATDIVTTTHPPQLASVGLGFVMAELRDAATLARARPVFDGLDHLARLGVPYLHCYVHSGDGFDLRARQLSAHDPLMEDPATGSANAALAALLAHYAPAGDGAFAWRIAQGVEMGRPSVLEARVEKRAGAVVRVRIGGETVPVTTGTLEL
jgi:trans-2,3-dihydro-3-hydroxyanthranilate isomerase